MAGKPWERYQNAAAQTATSTGKPWERFGGTSTGIGADQIENEMHSGISTGDRALLKNFANSNDVMIKHLKSKMPNADIRDQDGEIIIKDQGESKYRKLDPSGFKVGDLGHDALDIGYDIYDGVSSSLATVGGAVAGAAAGLGVGSVPGALAGGVVAGGAVSAGNEAMRQKIGQKMGLEQDVDMTDVAISGGLGAASPLLLGTGATTKQVAKGVLKGDAAKRTIQKALGFNVSEELSKRGALEAAEMGNKGVIQHGWAGLKGGGKRIGALTSGKSVEQMNDYAKNIDYVNRFDGNEALLEEEAGKRVKQFGEGFNKRFQEIGGELGDAIDATGKKVDLTGAKQAMISKIRQLEKLQAEDNSPILKAQIERLRKSYRDAFSNTDVPETPVMDWASGTMKSAPTEIADQVSGRAAFAKQGQLKRMAKFDQLSEGVATADGTPVDMSMMRGAAREGYHSINKGLDDATDGVSQELKNKYGAMKSVESNLEPFFEDTKKALKTSTSFDKQSYLMARSNLEKAIKNKVDGADGMKQFISAAQWANPNLTGKIVPASGIGIAAGSYAGANSGQGQGTAMIGGGIGGVAGNFLLGPKAMKQMIKATVKAEKTGKGISKKVGQISRVKAGKRNLVGTSLYHLMDEED